MNSITLISNSVNETISIGRDIGQVLMSGDAVALIGELGAGKTYLAKGIASGLGILESQEIVSPSFILVNEYTCNFQAKESVCKIPIYHIDFYRINSAREIEGIGIYEYLESKRAIKIIEWADKFPDLLPEDHLQVSIKILDENRREFKLKGMSKDFKAKIEKLKSLRRDVTHLMLGRLPDRISTFFKYIGELADKIGVNAYVVGGFVRDLLLKKDNFDLDIVVEGDGIRLAKDFAKRFDAVCKSHRRFGTSVVLLQDGFRIDFATARREYYKLPAALPIVKQSFIKNDLFRRDFTINALAIKLSDSGQNMLVDYFGGQKDIKEKRIRVLHDLSFVDDPTRVFRAIRFEQRLNFKIDKDTEELIRDAIQREIFHRLSGKRLFAELILILKEKHCYRAIWRMKQFGLLRFFHERLQFTKSQEDLMKRIDEVITWYRSNRLDEEYQDWLVYLIGLVIKLEENDFKEFCDRLSVPQRFRHSLNDVRTRYKDIMVKLGVKINLKPSEIVEILQGLSIEGLLFLMALGKEHRIAKYILSYLTKLMKIRREINGEDLKRLGIKPGPEFGRILDEIYRARLDEVINSREEEIEFAKKIAERYKG